MRVKGLLLIFGLCSALTGASQLMNLSPYSRFGLGDLYHGGNPGSLGLGGVSATFNDPAILNADNPATIGSLFNTTFQTSLRLTSIRLSEGDQSNRLNNGFLDQFQLVFKRPGSRTGYLIGMSPVSTTGYVIQTENDIANVGRGLYTYEGRGGITRAYIGIGRRYNISAWKHFYDKDGAVVDSTKFNRHAVSVGATGNYMFGNVTQSRLVEIQNTTFLGARYTDTFRMSDVTADLGLHYEYLARVKFGKDRKIVERLLFQAGLIYSPEFNVNTSVESYSESVVVQGGSAFAIDTAFALVGEGQSTLPQRMRGGVAVHYHSRKGRHIMLAADVEQRDWSRFMTSVGDEELNPGLVSSMEVAVGMQYTPRSLEEADNLFQRSQYRVGFRNTATYLSVQGNQVLDRALSMGITIPMISSRSASKFHLGMEIGGRGKNDGIMIREDYVNGFVGFSLSPFVKNAWFVQRKYD